MQTSWAAAPAAGRGGYEQVAVADLQLPTNPTAGLHTPRMHHGPPALDTCPHRHTTCLIPTVPPPPPICLFYFIILLLLLSIIYLHLNLYIVYFK